MYLIILNILDLVIPCNYRPVSKLSFISKVLKKVVCKQLLQVLDKNDIFDNIQSGFHFRHSTETALLRVSNHILMCVDAGECSVLLLFEPSAAFLTTDHSVLLSVL